MPIRKANSPSVSTFADHEVITPPNELRKTLVHVNDPSDDPIARAEAALAGLSGQFGDWMKSECERLDAARHQVKRDGLNEKTCDVLFRAAHDIKGEAATFGFPAVAGIVESLCRLIEHTPERSLIPLGLIDQHVDAVRAVIRENSHAQHAELAEALTRGLRGITDEFLIRENSFRPDYLETILAPSLAPSR